MSVEPIQFLTVAEASHELSNEIGYRNSVSRSYYAMFHQVKSILKIQPHPKHDKGVHGSLIDYLAKPSPDEEIDSTILKRLSFMLRTSRDMRNKADYQLDQDIFDINSSSDAINRAKRLNVLCIEAIESSVK